MLLPEVTRLLKEQGAEDILVFAGGIIPEQDIAGLKSAGVDAIFLPGTSTKIDRRVPAGPVRRRRGGFLNAAAAVLR